MARRSAAEVLRALADDVDRRGVLAVILDRGLGNLIVWTIGGALLLYMAFVVFGLLFSLLVILTGNL